MKKQFYGSIIVAMLLLLLLIPVTATAATPAEIEQACDDGLVWLAAQQNADGSWGSSEKVAHTGLALLKFETHAHFLGLDPFDPVYMYSTNVQNGLSYLWGWTDRIAIAVQPAGNPDTNGNGIGVRCWDVAHHRNYGTGIALMAISASGNPNRIVPLGSESGRTYKAVAQDIVDYFAFGQNEAVNDRGGWGYDANDNNSDNSNAGYVTLGLGFAESSAPWGFNCTIPAFVFSEIDNIWIPLVQDTVNGDANDGGSWYRPISWAWVNILKTGNLLHQMAMVGDTQASGRVQDAVDYMERRWNNANQDPGWRGSGASVNYQACFTTMKGFQALGIDTFGSVPIDWYADIADRIVTTQNADGSWSGGIYGDSVLDTAWALLTLEKAAPPALELLPPFATNPVGTNHTVTAVYKKAGVPQAGITINFEVTAGQNAGEVGSDITDANGEATFTYTGVGGPGIDIIQATAIDATGVVLVSATAEKTWIAAAEAPGITGWGILAVGLALVFLTVLMLGRRQIQVSY